MAELWSCAVPSIHLELLDQDISWFLPACSCFFAPGPEAGWGAQDCWAVSQGDRLAMDTSVPLLVSPHPVL